MAREVAKQPTEVFLVKRVWRNVEADPTFFGPYVSERGAQAVLTKEERYQNRWVKRAEFSILRAPVGEFEVVEP